MSGTETAGKPPNPNKANAVYAIVYEVGIGAWDMGGGVCMKRALVEKCLTIHDIFLCLFCFTQYSYDSSLVPHPNSPFLFPNPRS